MNDASWLPLASLQSPRLAPNLSYLSTFDPILYQKMQNAADEELLVQRCQGLIRCRTNAEPTEWIVGEGPLHQELQRLQQDLKAYIHYQGLVVLLGGAVGYALQCLIPCVLKNKQLRLLLVESSTARLQLCLQAVDVRSALTSGRFHLAVSEPSPEGILSSIDRFQLWNQPCAIYQTNGFPAQISSNEFKAQYQNESQKQKQKRIEIVEGFRRRANVNTDKAVNRVLLVDFWPNAPQTLHVKTLHKALLEKSIQAEIHPIAGFRFDVQGLEYRRLIERPFLNRLQEFQPDLILSYAYHAPHILSQEEFEALNVPWIQVVSNLVFYDRTYYANEYSAIAERGMIPEYRKRGATRPFFAPIAANYVAEQPTPTMRGQKIVFVGNSLALSNREAHEYLQSIQSRTRLFEFVRDAESQLSDVNRRMNFYEFVQGDLASLAEDDRDYYDAFRYLLCQSTAARRRRLLESIAGYGLRVYGNWSDLPIDSPLKACLKGPLPIEREMDLYSQGHIFVNVHSVGHITGPNMRFFNSPGMGGLSISDGVFSAFLEPDKEYVAFTSKSEFVDRVRYYLDRVDEADEIRANGLRRIQREWTYGHWFECVMKEIKR